MQLILFRHGIAEDRAADGTDASRALTAEGVEKTRAAAAGLARLIERPDAILTSPKVRAMQTAQIVGEALGRPPEVLHALAGESVERVHQALARRREALLIAVGHEPTLSRLIERLCTGGEAAGFIELKKAGAACLDAPLSDQGTVGSARLLWLATPRMLRSLAAER